MNCTAMYCLFFLAVFILLAAYILQRHKRNTKFDIDLIGSDSGRLQEDFEDLGDAPPGQDVR